MAKAVAAKTPEHFLNLLEKSKLLDAEQLQKAAAIASEQDDTKELARALVRREFLTPWQAGQILGGWHNLVVGNYCLLEQAGKSEVGRTFVARHRKLEREVEFLTVSRSVIQDSELMDRIIASAQAASALNHTHLLHLLDVQRDAERCFIISERVQGRDLATVVESQDGLLASEIADLIAQAAEGLAHAHENDVVHGDITPADLVVDDAGQIKIRRMGIARFEQMALDEAVVPEASDDVIALSRLALQLIDDEEDGIDQLLEYLKLGDAGELSMHQIHRLVRRWLGEQTPPSDQEEYSAPALDMDEEVAEEETDDPAAASPFFVQDREEAAPVKPPARPTADDEESEEGADPATNRIMGLSMTQLIAVAAGVLILIVAGVVVMFMLPGGKKKQDQVAKSTTNTSSSNPEDDDPEGDPEGDPESSTKTTANKFAAAGKQGGPANFGMGGKAKTNIGGGNNQNLTKATKPKSPFAGFNNSDAKQKQDASKKAKQAKKTAAPANKKKQPANKQTQPPNKKKQPPPQAKKKAPPKPAATKKKKAPPAKPKPPAKVFHMPKVVQLPKPSTRPVALGRALLKQGDLLFVKLSGGLEAIRGENSKIEMSQKDGATWEVALIAKSKKTLIGRFTIKNNQFQFSWTPEAEKAKFAYNLCNCVLELSARSQTHEIALRQPVKVDALLVNFDRTANNTKWQIDYLPDPNQIRIEVGRFEGGKMPKHRWEHKIFRGNKGRNILWIGDQPKKELLGIRVESRATTSMRMTLSGQLRSGESRRMLRFSPVQLAKLLRQGRFASLTIEKQIGAKGVNEQQKQTLRKQKQLIDANVATGDKVGAAYRQINQQVFLHFRVVHMVGIKRYPLAITVKPDLDSKNRRRGRKLKKNRKRAKGVPN